MTNDEGSTNAQMTKQQLERSSRHHSDFVIPSSLDIHHSSLSRELIATASQLSELLPHLKPIDRVAVDTEADSLHCYYEKLCLLQLSFGGQDVLIDPLTGIDLSPLSAVLVEKEIVLQGADFDLRLMRRSINFAASRIFDTVIAARLLGIRAFSLAALVERFFGIILTKGSQKANWAQRPLPSRMAEYAMNDTHYLLPLAAKLEEQLIERGRLKWFQESCQRALDLAAVSRVRDEDEAWRIAGSGKLRGRAAALLRSLWAWRDREARAADRPPFHILQNQQLIAAAIAFDANQTPDYRHFSTRRRRGFLEAAEAAMRMPENEWPTARPRTGSRPTPAMDRRSAGLRQTRDRLARELDLEPSFIAPRSTLESIAADEARSVELLVPWQRILLEV
jgi:ribonuclease D